MNIHHLELFHYVARHGGISQAVRNIPYGIQQPAVSAQIIQLEDALGAKLFQRRPFQLTPAGSKLYEFIAPFFENLARIEEEIRGQTTQFIRLGASNAVLRDHFPALLRAVRQRLPGLRVTLHEELEPQLLAWLERQEIDLAVTVLPARPPTGIHTASLVKVPLVLLVPARSRIKAAAELWGRDRIDEALISLPAAEPVSRQFQHGLAQRRVDWPPTIVVNSLDLIETYVAQGFGLGVSVEVPKSRPAAAVRRLPLDGFAPIEVGALWAGRPTPLVKLFVEELQARARALAAVS